MTELGPLAIEPENRPGGLTVLETECIAEIVDHATGEPVAAGEEGELVVTNLGRLGSPLIRYRTGDRVRAQAAGQLPLLSLAGGILGRTDEMITIRGNNLYPSALEDAIRAFFEIAEFRIEVRTEKAMQHVRVEIEPVAGMEVAQADQLAVRVAEEIKNRWHFHADVAAVAPGSLPRFEMKARRFTRVD
jgi:phenylacetate-CoA ligase